MNLEQRLYGLKFNTKLGSQNVDPLSYFRTLDIIKERKTQYPLSDKFIIKRIPDIPYKNHFVMESNKKYNNKIMGFRERPVAPKLNIMFLELDQRIKNNKEKIKENNTRALTFENKKYNIRVKNQKPKMLKANYLSQLYLDNHDKYMELLLRNSRFTKSNNNIKKTMVKLPNITGYKNGRLAKFHSKTEYNLDKANDNDKSKDNSIEQKDHKYNEISHQKQGHINKENN